VLIRRGGGDSGNRGKEVVAGAIHRIAPRRDLPFVKVNWVPSTPRFSERECSGTYAARSPTHARPRGAVSPAARRRPSSWTRSASSNLRQSGAKLACRGAAGYTSSRWGRASRVGSTFGWFGHQPDAAAAAEGSFREETLLYRIKPDRPSTCPRWRSAGGTSAPRRHSWSRAATIFGNGIPERISPMRWNGSRPRTGRKRARARAVPLRAVARIRRPTLDRALASGCGRWTRAGGRHDPLPP